MKATDWHEDVFKQYELMWVQKFHGNGQIRPPVCDECLKHRAIGLWQGRDGKAHSLCFTCSAGAEPPIAGVSYRPTEYPKAQPVETSAQPAAPK